MSGRTPVKVRARTKNWRASGRRNRYSRALVQFHTRKQQVVVAATRGEPKASADAALGCTPQRRELEVSVRLDQQAPRALKSPAIGLLAPPAACGQNCGKDGLHVAACGEACSPIVVKSDSIASARERQLRTSMGKNREIGL